MVVLSKLPKIGLGMAALGRPGYITLDRNQVFDSEKPRSIDTMQGQANQVMDTLFEKSQNNNHLPWLDCARSYGLSEQFVGEYLRHHNVKPHEDVYVSSKWGYTYVADWKVELPPGQPHEVKDHSVGNFQKQLRETLEHIGDYVNLYQIHSATLDSGVLQNEEVHDALANCREERGWSIGLSVSGPQQDKIIQTAMKLKTKSGEALFDSVQCTYNILEQRPQKILIEAHLAGMDIIIKEGVANGRVFQNESLLNHAKHFGCPPDQLALGCILAQPFQPRVLSGAVESWQLESNLESEAVVAKLRDDPKILQEIMDSCVMVSEEYWDERSALAWN
mmetsp:Transcript_15847/g.24007  ORF Transcript_15847/g.24007 Transcript_15847/m.24007 type:complete len:334 (-) Transcript_15847:84-1085(-)